MPIYISKLIKVLIVPVILLLSFVAMGFSAKQPDIKKVTPRHTTKVSAPVLVTLSERKISEDEDSSFYMITATIMPFINFNEIKTTWVLPEGVELIKGQSSEEFVTVEKQNELQLEAVFKVIGPQQKLIKLMAQGKNSDSTQSSIAGVELNTKPKGLIKSLFDDSSERNNKIRIQK